jgi:ABC-2 type transport system permease protein
MIGIVARKEFRDLVRDGRFRVAGGGILLLLVAALLAGFQQYRSLRRQHDAAERLTRVQWLTQGEKNPHSAAHYGVYAFKPQLPLSYVDRGVNTYTGTTAWLEAHRQNDFTFRAAQDAPALQRFGDLTGALILQVLVPLLIVFLTFGQFAGERENGTLRQLLSTSADPRRLAAGKALGTLAALLLLLTPAALLGAGASVLGAATQPVPVLGRFTLLALLYLGYFLVFALIALGISARARSSRTALVGLLGFWVINSMVAPRLAADVSKRLYATPSALEFQKRVDRDMQQGLNGHDPADRRAAALEQRVLAQYGVTSIKDLPVNFDGIRLQEGEEYGNRVFDKHFAALWRAYNRQTQLHELGGVIAPLLAVRSLSMGLAGTDFAHHRHFASAAEQYRRTLVKQMNDDMTLHADTAGFDYMAGQETWAKASAFSYRAPGLDWIVQQHVPGALVLIGWLVLATLFLAAQIRRLRVDT